MKKRCTFGENFENSKIALWDVDGEGMIRAPSVWRRSGKRSRRQSVHFPELIENAFEDVFVRKNPFGTPFVEGMKGLIEKDRRRQDAGFAKVIDNQFDEADLRGVQRVLGEKSGEVGLHCIPLHSHLAADEVGEAR